MAKSNFMDSLEVHKIHKLYIKSGLATVVEDGHAACTFNENKHNPKAYMALNDYGRERYRNTMAVDIY